MAIVVVIVNVIVVADTGPEVVLGARGGHQWVALHMPPLDDLLLVRVLVLR